MSAPGSLEGAPAPLVIAGVGGSGTRVFARIAMLAGVYMGANRNASEDALDLKEFTRGWLKPYAASGGRLPPAKREAIQADLFRTLATYRREIGDPLRPWGWKQPRSLHFLPLFDGLLPGIRFLHVIRDGRDVAFGKINALVWAADAYLGPDRVDEPVPLRMLRFWVRANEVAADYGERSLRDRYLRVRFEDLCAEPRTTIETLTTFAGAGGRADDEMLAQVQPPETVGRWRGKRPELVAQIEREGRRALTRFGYV